MQVARGECEAWASAANKQWNNNRTTLETHTLPLESLYDAILKVTELMPHFLQTLAVSDYERASRNFFPTILNLIGILMSPSLHTSYLEEVSKIPSFFQLKKTQILITINRLCPTAMQYLDANDSALAMCSSLSSPSSAWYFSGQYSCSA